MTNIRITVNGTAIAADLSGDLTTGMVGAAYEAEYDSAWDGLAKLVIFRAGEEQIIALDGKVPPVLLTKENVLLQVGVEGRNHDGDLIMPTTWTNVGYVIPGAKGKEDPGIEPDNPAWKQSAALAQEALDKANRLQQRADSGEFQGTPGPQGPGYEHSDEFTHLAANVHQNAETAERAAKLSGRNASMAASSASAAASSEAGVKADADRAAQAAGQAEQNALTILGAVDRAETAAGHAAAAGTDARQAAESAQTEAQKAEKASVTAQKEADRAEKSASLNKGFLVRPPLRNGSLGNVGNADAIGMKYVVPTYGARSIIVKTDISAAPGSKYYWVYRLFGRAAGAPEDTAEIIRELEIRSDENWIKLDAVCPGEQVQGFAVCLFEEKTDGSTVQHRIETDGDAFVLAYNFFDPGVEDIRKRVENIGKNYGLVTVSPLAEISAVQSKTNLNMLMTFKVVSSDAEFCLNPGSYMSFSEVHTQLPDCTSWQVDGNQTTFTISMKANETLLFDPLARKFSVVQNLRYPVEENQTVCLQSRINTLENGHCNFVGGSLYNQYIGNIAEKLSVQAEEQLVSPDYSDKISKFAGLFCNAGCIDSYLFFTDPHYMGFPNYERLCRKSLSKMKFAYERAPVTYCVCGGDWLQNSDTPQEAAAKLSFGDACARSCFRDYVPMIGNHDTNYQGSGRLSGQALQNLMFRQEGSAYYAHRSPTTTAYVFDSGIDWETNMDDYKWKQVDWFARSLAAEDPAHSYVALHIGLDSTSNAAPPLTDNIIKIMNAYNGRKSLRLNGSSYNFSGKKGTCHYILAGHNHEDASTVVNGVPVILSEAVILADNDPQPHEITHEDAFTLCLADYDSHVLHCVRCGWGEDRDIQILPTVL